VIDATNIFEQKELFLFDWDGTLARTLETWLDNYHQALFAIGMQVTDDQVIASFGISLTDAAQKLGVFDSIKIDKFRDIVKVLAEQRNPVTELYPGAVELLEKLSSLGKKVALITSSGAEVVSRALEYNNLQDRFVSIISADDVANHKPHPEGILRVLQELNIDPVNAVMLGDSDKDLLAASNANIDSVLFYPIAHQLFYDLRTLKACKPTYIIDDWKTLLA
jgi:pyrophosphatase PpaX